MGGEGGAFCSFERGTEKALPTHISVGPVRGGVGAADPRFWYRL